MSRDEQKKLSLNIHPRKKTKNGTKSDKPPSILEEVLPGGFRTVLLIGRVRLLLLFGVLFLGISGFARALYCTRALVLKGEPMYQVHFGSCSKLRTLRQGGRFAGKDISQNPSTDTRLLQCQVKTAGTSSTGILELHAFFYHDTFNLGCGKNDSRG